MSRYIEKSKDQSNNHSGSYVDEYGQIVRPNSSSSTSNNTASDEGWKTFFKGIGTIIVLTIGIFITIAIANAGDGIFLVAIPILAVSGILKLIWDD